MKELVICTVSELEDRLKRLLFTEEFRRMEENFPPDCEVYINLIRQILPSLEEVSYVASIGAKPAVHPNYKLYIGPDVDKVIEMYGGVELPSSVLDDSKKFNKEVLARIQLYFFESNPQKIQ